jgi:eukaryotic-like serine/threonine-protein kinase
MVRSELHAMFLTPTCAQDTDTPEHIKSPCEGPGTHIGPYKLFQQLGEGGFGIVYMAERDRPVHRRVALKIIKPGMDSA